jgi:hypothetical protein
VCVFGGVSERVRDCCGWETNSYSERYITILSLCFDVMQILISNYM